MAKRAGRRAVSPVLATLIMVAVAVAMSVIIFTWSQGFLSQTGEAASAQQAAQNVAAQSGILIEAATFDTTNDDIIAYVRNVGSATVIVDTAEVVIRSGATTTVEVVDISSNISINPRSSNSVTIDLPTDSFDSGDVVTVKLITTVGTFAQATYTVP